MNRENMKKAEEPEHIKIEKVGDTISGKFLSIEKSGRYEDGYALLYSDETEKMCVSFVNNMARGLIENNNLDLLQEFELEFIEEVENKDKKFKYRKFGLWIGNK